MAKQTKNKKMADSAATTRGAAGSSRAERQFGVILENIDSKFDLLLEGHHALDKKIDKNHEEFKEFRGEVNYKFEVVFEKFDEIDAQFKNIDAQFKNIDAQFKNIDAQFGEVKDELRIIRNELKEKVSRDEFVLLEKRVLKLEKARG